MAEEHFIGNNLFLIKMEVNQSEKKNSRKLT